MPFYINIPPAVRAYNGGLPGGREYQSCPPYVLTTSAGRVFHSFETVFFHDKKRDARSVINRI